MKRAPTPQRSAGLRWLLHPIAPESFLSKHWEKRPLFIKRGVPDYYKGILTSREVDRIISSTSLRSPNIKLVRDGEIVATDVLNSNDLLTHSVMHDALIEEYRKGTTIILQMFHENWEPVSDLCLQLSKDTSAAFQANLYITPRTSRGFPAHFDDHDVFVVQVAGHKVWKMHNRPEVYLPSRRERHHRTQPKPDEDLQELSLNQGDCAYIPRGWVHEAATDESPSIHLTLGMNTLTWEHLIARAVAMACSEPTFKRSLPLGFAVGESSRSSARSELGTLLTNLAGSLNAGAMIEDATIIADRSAQRTAHGRLIDVDVAPIISDETQIWRRPEVEYRLEVDESETRLYFAGKLVTLPARIARVMEFITMSKTSFVPGDLPGGLDEGGRMVLLRRLITEGFLTVSHEV